MVGIAPTNGAISIKESFAHSSNRRIMAANKEAIVIVLDVGPFMRASSGSLSPLQNAKACIGMILQRKIFSESKDEIALVLCGTPETRNKLAETIKDEYTNISVKSNLKTADWDLMQSIQEIEGTNIIADYVDALVVAMDVLTEETKVKKFSSQRILMFSNFRGDASNDQVDVIIKGIRNTNIQLNIIDSEDNNSSLDARKLSQQVAGKALMWNILKEVQGEAYSFSDAVPALTFYQKKAVQSVGWNATLEISSRFKLPITGYIKISPYKFKSWKTACAVDTKVEIKRETSHHLNDEAQTEVAKEDIINGYRYGTTLIPFSEEDKINMSYKAAEKGIKVLGFTKEDNIKQHHYLGDKVMYIIGQKNNESVEKTLSAFIQALYETGMVAIVRYAYSANSAPKLGFLAPRIKQDYECLVFIQLPFMEDLRHFTFAPLDIDAKNLPSDEQLSTMGELISAMDLTAVTSEEDGNDEELFKSSQTINPYLQRYFQCLQHRALHPEHPLPEIPSHIANVLKAPQVISNASKPIVERLKKLFPTEEITSSKATKTGATVFHNGDKTLGEPPLKRSRTGNENFQGGMADLLIGNINEVGTVTPVEDFKKLITLANCHFSEVCKQLQNVILKLIKDPLGGGQQLKAISCLKAYREESLKRVEPLDFNTFLKDLKELLVSSHKKIWEQIASEKINLISNRECKKSDVSVHEAGDFFITTPTERQNACEEEDEEDLLAQM